VPFIGSFIYRPNVAYTGDYYGSSGKGFRDSGEIQHREPGLFASAEFSLSRLGPVPDAALTSDTCQKKVGKTQVIA